MLALIVALAGPALAQDPEVVSSETTVPEKKPRDYFMEVNFRGRYLTLPDAFLDLGYFKHTGETIERPDVNAYSLGLEFVVKGKGDSKRDNGIFYIEYMNPLIEPGYWDDVESPANSKDGNWLKPDQFALVVIGADYASEFVIKPWFSFLVGAGLGGGIVLGELTTWEAGEPEGTEQDNTDPSCGPDEPAYLRKNHCSDDGPQGQIPQVLPFLDVNVGVRFNINDHAAIRLEGGIHDLFYVGSSVGIVF